MEQKQQSQQKKQCLFCLNNVRVVDYKNVELLRKYINTQHKIQPRRKTGTCALCQRRLAKAIKQARVLSLLSFTIR